MWGKMWLIFVQSKKHAPRNCTPVPLQGGIKDGKEMKERKRTARFGKYFSPWLVIGLSAILAVAVGVLAWVNYDREKDYMARILSEKGAALIKSFEAGARTGMMGTFGGGIRLQTLLEETAAQPDILFIALTDRQGRILAHNDPSRVGTAFTAAEDMRRLKPGENVQWSIASDDKGAEAFTVYSDFLPVMRLERGPEGGFSSMRQMHERMGREHRGHKNGANRQALREEVRRRIQERLNERMRQNGLSRGPAGQEQAPDSDRSFPCAPGWFDSFQPERLLDPEQRPVIFIGMDVEPFQAARAEDMRLMAVTSLTVLLLGVAGVVSLFWAQGYARSRKQLADARSFAAEVVAGLPAGLVFAGPDGQVMYANETAHRLLGLGQDAVGRQADDILPGRVLTMFETLDDENTLSEQGMELDGAEGPVPVDASVSRILSEEGEFLGRLVFLKDLSEVRRLEQEVRRREKLAAVGNLAAGVAHEVRNPLSSIKGYATYFGSLFDDGSENRKAAEIMAAETDRLNRVITELLEFARPSELNSRPVDVAGLVDNTLRLIRQEAESSGVLVESHIDEDLPGIQGDSDRLNQALLNLCINGIQAMQPGGMLRVSATGEEDRVVLRVSDTGRGIAEEDLSKMFDPYFTTKPSGTGLGLAVVQKIIEAHGGEIRVKSQPGEGTEVSVSLPAAKENA